jgi:hypothetical protein
VAALTAVWLVATPAAFFVMLFLGWPVDEPGGPPHGLHDLTPEEGAGLDATYRAMDRGLIAFAVSAVLGPVVIAAVAVVTRLRKTAAGYAVLAVVIGASLAYVTLDTPT